LNCLTKDFLTALNDVCLKNELMSLSLNRRPGYLAIKHPSEAYDLNFITVRQLDSCGFVDMGALSDEKTGLSFTTAVGPRQRSDSRV
jgi:hypothetical protein